MPENHGVGSSILPPATTKLPVKSRSSAELYRNVFGETRRSGLRSQTSLFRHGEMVHLHRRVAHLTGGLVGPGLRSRKAW